MPKIKKSIKPNSFIDFEDIKENTAVYNFNDNSLKQGKVNLNSKQLDRISFLLAHDLKTFIEAIATFQLCPRIQFTLICKTINKTKREEVEKTSSFYVST